MDESCSTQASCRHALREREAGHRARERGGSAASGGEAAPTALAPTATEDAAIVVLAFDDALFLNADQIMGRWRGSAVDASRWGSVLAL